MQLTEEQKIALQAKLEALAGEYAADPQKGREAGYQPEQVWHQEPEEHGGPKPRLRKRRSDYTAWLYGIAGKDLPPGTWRIDESAGDGPGSASLDIL